MSFIGPCDIHEAITKVNLNSGIVNIISSTHSKYIKHIIPGGRIFHFQENDHNPFLIVTLNPPKIPYSLSLEGSDNVKHYNIKITYEDDSVEEFKVSGKPLMPKNFNLFNISTFNKSFK